MPDPTQAEREYRSAMELYARGAFADAISAFDRAIALGNQSWKVLDAKAATLFRMGERKAAFEIATKLCKKYGEANARPWYRVAMILSAMGTYNAAERSISKGLSLTTDAAVRKTLTDLRTKNSERRAQAQANLTPEEKLRQEAALKAKMCFTHLLPYDILILVAEAGRVHDPDLPIRMAGVCSEWRRTVFSYGPLWSHLRVGRRRPLQKIDFWMKRNNGCLKDLTLLEAPSKISDDVFPRLADHLEPVERLVIHASPGDNYFKKWRHQFRSLKSITIKDSLAPHLYSETLALDLVHPDATCSLESVSLKGSLHIDSRRRAISSNSADTEHAWMTNHAQLRNLRTLDLINVDLELLGPKMTALLANTPQLTELKIGLYIGESVPRFRENVVLLENLNRLEIAGNLSSWNLLTHQLEAPNLEHFSCYNSLTRNGPPITARLGQAQISLSRLVSLELTKHFAVSMEGLLRDLDEMTSLEFLSLPFYAELRNDLLEYLVVEEGKPVVLPKLRALSITGNDNISAGPIRRLVLSRNAPHKLVKTTIPVERKRSAFAPTKKSKPTRSPPDTSPSGTPASSTVPSVARLNWLCFDHCNNPHFDTTVLDSIRPYVGFLSAQGGAVNQDRIRGRGAYAWDIPDRIIPVPGEVTASSGKRKADGKLSGEPSGKVRR